MVHRKILPFVLITGVLFAGIIGVELYLNVQFRSILQKQIGFSTEINEEYLELVSAMHSAISEKDETGFLGTDKYASDIRNLIQQELDFWTQEDIMLIRMRSILITAIIAIVLFLVYLIWFSAKTTLVPMREREADVRTRMMLDTTPMLCLLWETDGTLIDCNKETLRLTGFTDKSEYIKKFFNMLPEFQPNGEESHAALIQYHENAYKNGSAHFEWLLLTGSGEELPLDVTIVSVPWNDGYRLAVYALDLREVKAKEVLARKTENNLRRIMATAEASPNLTFFLGASGNIEFVNPAVSGNSGYSAEELQKYGLSLMFDPEDFRILKKEYLSAALKGLSVNFEMTMIAKTGDKLDIYFSVFPVVMNDGSTGIGMIGRNITEQKQMQKDLAIAKEHAEKALESELRYNKAKSNFLSKVSHELRTPLNAIIGITNAAEKTTERKELEKYCHSIRAASKNLLSLVNDILDHTSIDTASFDFSPRQFSFSKALSSVIGEISMLAKEKNQELILNISGEIHDCLYSDERRLKQVLLNLLLNAVKFTPENGKITFSAREFANYGTECIIRFQVIDSGVGISHEALSRLYETFEQADNSITREHSGLGLGLSLTKRIVEIMHGYISVESEEGKGTCFTCDLKLEIVKEEKQQELKAPGAHNDLDLNGKYILVADDVEINREVLFAMLENSGAVLEGARNGEEAVKMFSEKKYDLVLIDLHMPVMDGFTASKNIRASAQSWAKTVPIISISAESSGELRLKCFEAGINDNLMKPVEAENLLKAIGRWLGKAR